MTYDKWLAVGILVILLFSFAGLVALAARKEKHARKFGLTRDERICLLTRLALDLKSGKNTITRVFYFERSDSGANLSVITPCARFTVYFEENGQIGSSLFVDVEGKNVHFYGPFLSVRENVARMRLALAIRDSFLAGRLFRDVVAELPPAQPKEDTTNLRDTALFRESGCCSQNAQEKA